MSLSIIQCACEQLHQKHGNRMSTLTITLTHHLMLRHLGVHGVLQDGRTPRDFVRPGEDHNDVYDDACRIGLEMRGVFLVHVFLKEMSLIG